MKVPSTFGWKSTLFTLFFFLGSFSVLFSQKIVDVNLLTGSANINIPIFNVSVGDISAPVILGYQGNGLQVEDYNQNYGLGWRLSAEASVTRIVKGFPDDIQYVGGNGFTTVKGWLTTTDIPGKIENFSIANDNNLTTCADEVSDYSYMNSNFSDYFDTEPDIFIVNAPGLSFQFVFDKNKNIQVVPYQDIIIDKTTDANGIIQSFTVTDSRGIKYFFDKYWLATQHIDEVISPSSVDAFKRNYMFYRHDAAYPAVAYNWKWNLTYMLDTKGNKITYTYDNTQDGVAKKANEKVEVVKYNPSTGNYDKQYLYTNQKVYSGRRLSKITIQNNVSGGTVVLSDEVKFAWENNYTEARLTEIQLSKAGQRVLFDYSRQFAPNSGGWGRSWLKSLAFRNTYDESEAKYLFEYKNVDVNATTDVGTCYCTSYDSITNAQDYWGYYSGFSSNANLTPSIWVYPDNANVSKYKITQIPGYGGNVVALTGVNRTPNSNAVSGSLFRITYPGKAVTEIEYDNNEYFDKDVNAGVIGGGIRVRKITNNDGLNTNSVTYYDYNDPSTSITTGKALSLPSFTFAFPNTTTYGTLTDKVKNSTFRTTYDFSDESKEILYSKVTVRKTNGGKTVYEFNTPGTWQTSNINEWAESMVYVSRPYTSNPSPCNAFTPDFFTNGKNNYPFPSNTYFDFERGLLIRTSSYNESGQLVSQEDYTYQRSHSSPALIQALKFDDVKGVRVYAKYNVLATIADFPSTHIVKQYNLNNPTLYTTTSESFYYESGAHKLLTKLVSSNSDGASLISRIKYAKDFTTTGTGDVSEQAIHNLKLQNANAVIERYNSVIEPGASTEKVLAADLTTFKVVTNPGSSQNMYLPSESWKFISQSGATNFSPSTITSGNFVKYSSYFKTASIEGYDAIGNVVRATDNSRMYKTIVNYEPERLNIAEFNNAKSEEVILSTFDYNGYGYEFSIGGNSIIQPGRNSPNCLNFQPGTYLTRSLSNALTNRKIVFSCWVKGAATSGTITVNLSASGLNTNYTLPFSSDPNWKYYEVKFTKPVQSSFTVSVSTDVAVNIDDIIVVPDNATFKLNSIKNLVLSSTLSKFLLSAETGPNGVSKVYDYDVMARPIAVRDQDNNILELNIYKRANSWQTLSATISWSQPVYKDVASTITANTQIPYGVTGIQYAWTFGDGSSQTTSTASVNHTYTVSGTYQVSCTLTAPGYSAYTASSPVTTDPYALTVLNPPPATVYPAICAGGIIEKTSAGECILQYCTNLTSVCTQTIFKLDYITGGNLNDVETVLWQKALVGTENWSNIGSGTQVTVSFNPLSTLSYKVRCQVNMNNGASGTSNYITVLNNYVQ